MTTRTLRQLMDMRGRRVLLTGGGGHLGRVVAEAYAELGSELVLIDRDGEAAETVAHDVSERWSVDCQALEYDLEEPGIATEILRRAAPDGRLDVLVNAAAFVGTTDVPGWATSFEEQSADTWRRALEVNLTAPFTLVQAAAPMLRTAPAGGAVVNVSSIYGSAGPDEALYRGLEMGNPAAYAASKGGLEQLTRWLATTLAPEIRVNAIAPGGIERGQPEEFVQRYRRRTPLNRMATEEDLKGAFAYLGSGLSRYVTGQVLVVDGGWLAW